MKILNLLECSLVVAITLMLASCDSLPRNDVSAADLQKRQQALATSDYLIVPGQRIGPVRVGMGQDEVVAELGQPDYINVDPDHLSDDEWRYISLNLIVRFPPHLAVPAVSSVTTQLWSDGLHVAFRTVDGLGIGSSFFDVERADGTPAPGGENNMTHNDGHRTMMYPGIAFLGYSGATSDKVSMISIASPYR